MNSIKITTLSDGGTICLTTDKGMFFIDNRIGSSTIGRVYLGYPECDNSNLLNNPHLEDEIKKLILNHS
jgi:hypothetical protein